MGPFQPVGRALDLPLGVGLVWGSLLLAAPTSGRSRSLTPGGCLFSSQWGCLVDRSLEGRLLTVMAVLAISVLDTLAAWVMTSRSRWTGYRSAVSSLSVRTCRWEAEVAGRLCRLGGSLFDEDFPCFLGCSVFGQVLLRTCILGPFSGFLPSKNWEATFLLEAFIQSWFTHVTTRFLQVQGNREVLLQC